jgi:ankyrin repeat protein
MKKRMVVAVVLTVLLAASAYAQTTNFTDLVVYGTPQEVQAAIDTGADVNVHSDYRSALMVAAAYNKNPAVITILLRAGAEMNATDEAYGMTALMWSTRYNVNPEVILTLLKAGADAKAKSDEGKTAFDYAQLNAHLIGTEAILQLQKASQ